MGLIAFVKALEASEALQARVKNAGSPQVILDLAAEQGWTISWAELRAASRDLAADYWPWAAKGHAFRRAFFAISAGADHAG